MTAGAAADSQEVDPENPIPPARLGGRPLLLMLDVDGTLAPIAPRPSLARVPDETRRVLAVLATLPGISVVLVSGRAARDAQQVVGVPRLWTIGNHGAEVMDPSGHVAVEPGVARYADAMRRAVSELESALVPFDGAVLEDKTWTVSVHYRLADEAMVPRLRGVVGDIASRNDLVVREGKKVIEIRAPVGIDKGTAIRQLAETLGGLTPDASVLFAGDDATDEDAFQVLRAELPRAVTIHIGDDADTLAEFRLPAPEQLRALLEHIAHDFNRDR